MTTIKKNEICTYYGRNLINGPFFLKITTWTFLDLIKKRNNSEQFSYFKTVCLN